MSDSITIVLSAWDAGCLPGTLQHRIDEVKQHLRVCSDTYTPEARANAETFLSQLEGCLTAVNAARSALITSPFSKRK